MNCSYYLKLKNRKAAENDENIIVDTVLKGATSDADLVAILVTMHEEDYENVVTEMHKMDVVPTDAITQAKNNVAQSIVIDEPEFDENELLTGSVRFVTNKDYDAGAACIMYALPELFEEFHTNALYVYPLRQDGVLVSAKNVTNLRDNMQDVLELNRAVWDENAENLCDDVYTVIKG